jgi:hypothetical protein
MFSSLEQWREIVGTLDFHSVIPATVGSVYRRAQRIIDKPLKFDELLTYLVAHGG